MSDLARIIPNEETWVGFSTDKPAAGIPDAAEITAAINMTPYIISLTASSQGNTVPTPALDSLFDRTAQGTATAQFMADMYRDDDTAADADLAWKTLKRGTRGFFYISRFGGTNDDHSPADGESVEVWPVIISSRAMSGMTSNTVLTFQVMGAVTDVPLEDVTVGSALPKKAAVKAPAPTVSTASSATSAP